MATTTRTNPTTKAAVAAAAEAAEAKRINQAAALMKMSADGTRLRVLMLLMDGERNVTSLCARFHQSQPSVSHHLSLMRHGGLIVSRKQNKANFYSLTDKGRTLAEGVKAIIG
jgi:DNA-binding transcriptional ArsR family regulator